MKLSDITAHVMVKNEANFIGHILTPLIRNIENVLVYDTGSQDGTIQIIREMGIPLVEKGSLTPTELTACRNEMVARTKTEWCMMVDGDELYPEAFFTDLANYEVPHGKKIGFSKMCSVDFDPVQGYVLLDDFFSRLAFYPTQVKFGGNYPFESPDMFQDNRNFFYVESDVYAYHLHRLERSPRDHDVFMREDKRYLFGMQVGDRPIIQPVKLPLSDNFRDPYSHQLE